ncbi:MAG: ABC transporter ATP-binding protein/permease [Candidatus Omnitrophica bacterium]|nr:ABC transporter ATP-binding protein/permease [Candidatus Omnitrophota bacterium]
MKNLFRVLRFFWVDTPLILLVLVLLGLSTGLNLLKPWPLALIVDSLLNNKPWPAWMASWVGGWGKQGMLVILSLVILLVYFLQAGLSTVQNYLVIKVGLRGLARVRNRLFHWLARLSLRYYQGARQGDVIYRAAWDTYSFQTLFQHGLFNFVTACLSLGLMVAVMWQLNRLLTFFALGTVPLLLIAMRVLGRKMSRQSLAAHQADSRVTSQVQQTISAMPLIQSCTQEAGEERQYASQVARALRARLSQHGWEVVYLAAIGVVFGLGVGGIAWMGAQQVWQGRLTIGELLVFLAYLGQFYDPLNQLSRMGATLAEANAGTKRVFEILDTPVEVIELPSAKAAVPGAISFDAVSFGYEPRRLVLGSITFEIPAGHATALVGPSGAGKSTLLHLLPRFFDPLKGAVRLNGVDLRELRLNELRSRISLVMQEPLLMPGTVAENIAYGRPNATLDEIQTAARAAHADEFIQQLPEKYTTLVGEGGSRLSVGEKQRLSLGRAFLKKCASPDSREPTGSLDAESEALVNASLEELMRGRTTLIATHRPGILRQVDQVIVLEGGLMAEMGTPAELIQRGGYFARVFGARLHLP